jgi:hypothetical protein
MPKEITFYVFLSEKRDPSEIYANSNLRNLTHITQKPSYVYTFFTYTLKEITALGLFFAGFEECRQNVRDRMNDEGFSASYGVSASTLYAVLADLAVETPRIKTKDILMAVNELKLYLTEHVQAGRWDMDEHIPP